MKTRFYQTKVLFIWAFTALWITGVAVGSLTAVRDGIPPDNPRWVVAVAAFSFWAMAVWLVRYVLRRPCHIVSILPGGRIEAVLRYPLHAERRTVPAREALPLQVIQSEDQDGDPYFTLILPVTIGSGEKVVLAEGGQEHCQRTEQEFHRALARYQ